MILEPYTGLLLLALGACTAPIGSSDAGSLPLVVLDSVTLQESDSAYVGRATGFAVSPLRGFFVSDGFARRVVWFDTSGRVQGVIGRRGVGPGELEGPSSLTLLGDSLLVVADEMRRRYSSYGLDDRKVRQELVSDAFSTFLTSNGRTLIGGALGPARKTLLVRWEPPDTLRHHVGALPASLDVAHAPFYLSSIPVASWDDRIAFLRGDADHMFVSDFDGSLQDSIPLPRTRRRGPLLDAAEAWARREPPVRVASRTSYPVGLHRVRDGLFVAAHVDMTWNGTQQSGTTYLTVFGPMATASCIDVRLVGETEPPQRVVILGDTIYALSQSLTQDRVTLRVHRYLLDKGCARA